jgi:acyl carrier protein
MNEIKQFIEKYTKELLKEKHVGVDIETAAIGDYLDSLDIVDMICATENQFGIEMGEEYFFTVHDRTITEVAEYFSKKR